MSSCFGAVASGTTTSPAACYYSSSSAAAGFGGGGSSRRPWRWWRAKCAGIAAAVGYRIRKSIRRIDGRRRRAASSVHARRGCYRQHRRSFAPVYVDELYSHHHQQQAPKTALLRVARAEDEPSASNDDAKPAAAAAATTAPPVPRAAGKAAAAAADARRAIPVPARAGGAAVATAAAAAAGARATGGGKLAHAGGAMRSVLLRSPGRGGGVLGVVTGMGEVDLRAELFIRKFKEDMRLQSQRSAEELQAMLARGL
jgi:hypothetical protein